MIWQFYSKKLREKLDRLQFVGSFTEELANEKGMRLVFAKEKLVHLFWLVDESDGVIADAKFQAYGPPHLIAAAEIASELALRKNYDQISRLSADLIDRHVRDKKEIPAFPKECDSSLNSVLLAIDVAVMQCSDIPFESSYERTPIELDFGEVSEGIPGWDTFSNQQKFQVIEEVIDKEIRPYIELDAGGIKLIALCEHGEVLISYEGACTSCHASRGSTLSAIQKILKVRVHPSLFVTPQF